MPHDQPAEATFHSVFCLTGSLPGDAVDRLLSERKAKEHVLAGSKDHKNSGMRGGCQLEYFVKFDALLDRAGTGPGWLKDPFVADIVARSIRSGNYDRVIRNGEELERTLWYVMFNPVKTRLVREWNQWPWSYLKPDLLGPDRAPSS